MSSLIELLKQDHVEWKSVERLLKRHPEECKAAPSSSPSKGAPLFLVIEKDAPKPIILKLLNLDPDASKLVQHPTGLTPLYLAVSKGAHPDVIRLLLNKNPRAASQPAFNGCIALHSVENIETARLLLKAYPKGVAHRNNQGYLPLHRATYSSWATPDVIELLLNEGKKQHMKNGGVFMKTSPGDITPFSAISDVVCNQMTTRGGTKDDEIWKKFYHIARAAASDVDGDDEKSFQLLHATINLSCADFIIRTALLRHPEQCLEYDRNGRSALSYAAMKQDSSCEVIQMLIEKNPDAAGKADRMGRMPLHHVIVSGRPYGNGIQTIIRAKPKALEARDGVTGLYPFMLAASTRTPSTGDLTTIYSLLLEAPWLVTPLKQSKTQNENKLSAGKSVWTSAVFIVVVVAVIIHWLYQKLLDGSLP